MSGISFIRTRQEEDLVDPTRGSFLFFFSPPLFPFLWLNSIKRIPESVLSYHGLEKLRGRMASERFFFLSFPSLKSGWRFIKRETEQANKTTDRPFLPTLLSQDRGRERNSSVVHFFFFFFTSFSEREKALSDEYRERNERKRKKERIEIHTTILRDAPTSIPVN